MTAPEQDWTTAGARIDALVAASGSAAPLAEELVRLLTGLYGDGLERLLGLLHAHRALTDEVRAAFAADGLVAALLLVHGLHPEDTATRIGKALSTLDGATLVEITPDGVARLRLARGGGCGRAGLRRAVEQAVEAAAPELTGIRLEEPPADLIPIAALFSRRTPAGPGGAR